MSRIVPFAAALLLLAGAVSACTVEGTGGDLVPVEFAFVGGHDPADGPLVTETLYDPAWTVELEEARVVLGAAYLFPVPDVTTTAAWSPLSLLVSTARAHAGDDNLFAVTALAETLDPIVVDALDPTPQVVGPILGEADRAEQVSVWIDAPRGDLAGEDGPTHGYHGWVRGTATSGDRTIRFEAGITLDETPLSQRVDRIMVADGATDLESGSRITVTAVADEWLEQVDFDLLLESGQLIEGEDGVYRTDDNGFEVGWLINFHDPDAFRARVAPGDSQ